MGKRVLLTALALLVTACACVSLVLIAAAGGVMAAGGM